MSTFDDLWYATPVAPVATASRSGSTFDDMWDATPAPQPMDTFSSPDTSTVKSFDQMWDEATVDPEIKKNSALNKLKDTAIKVVEALNIPNAAIWAGGSSLLGNGDFGTLYKKYQAEGTPAAAVAKNAAEAMGVTNPIALGIASAAGDILGDPTTYLGLGALGKVGKAAKLTEELAKGGRTTAKATEAAAKVLEGVAPEARTLGTTLAEQAARGQRSAAELRIPFTDLAVSTPEAINKPVLAAVDKVKDVVGDKMAGILSTAPKLENSADRQLYKDGTVKARNRGDYAADAIAKKVQDFNESIKGVSKEDAAEIVDIAEVKDRLALAQAGKLGDIGEKAIKFRELLDIEKGIAENNVDALTKVGGQNLAGEWQHTMPDLGESAVRKAKDADPSAKDVVLPNYVTHVVPEDAVGGLEKKSRAVSEFPDKIINEFARKLVDKDGFPTYTTKQLNEMAGKSYDDLVNEGVPATTAGKIKRLDKAIQDYRGSKNILGFAKKQPEYVDRIFSTNPGFIASQLSSNIRKSVSGSVFKKDIGGGFGKTAEQVAENPLEYGDFKQIAKWDGSAEGKLFFAPEVSEAIEKTEGHFWGNKPTKDLIEKYYDPALNYWKSITLSIFPGYHWRNEFGNIITNAVNAGMRNPMYYKTALDLQVAEAKTGKGLVASGLSKLPGKELKDIKLKNGMTGEEALTLARQNGIRGDTAMREELQTGFEKSKNPLSTKGPVLRAGRAVGTALEDNSRLALFIHELDKGMSPETAAATVRKYLFDYGDVTPFEKNVAARALPFYRWVRFNTPMQLENLVKRPGKMTAVEHVREGINREQNFDDKDPLLQDYLASNIPIQVGKRNVNGKDMPAVISLGAWIPSYSTATTLAHPISTIIGMLTPIAKEPVEQTLNLDARTRKPIEDAARGKYTQPLFNKSVPIRVRHVVNNIRAFNEADRMIGSIINTVDPENSKYMLRSGFRPDVLENAVSLLTGVRTTPFDADEAAIYKKAGIVKDMRETVSGIKSAARRGDKANVQEGLKRFFALRDKLAAMNGLTQKMKSEEQP